RAGAIISQVIRSFGQDCRWTESANDVDANRHRTLHFENAQHIKETGRNSEIRNKQSRSKDGSDSGDRASVTDDLSFSSRHLRELRNNSCCSCSASDEKINRNLPAPLRLLEHGNAVITSCGARYRDRRAAWPDADIFDMSSLKSL